MIVIAKIRTEIVFEKYSELERHLKNAEITATDMYQILTKA